MPTLDDAPLGVDSAEPTSKWGLYVDGLIAAAEASPRARIRVLAVKADEVLSTLNAALERERRIAAAEAELSRLRRGES